MSRPGGMSSPGRMSPNGGDVPSWMARPVTKGCRALDGMYVPYGKMTRPGRYVPREGMSRPG